MRDQLFETVKTILPTIHGWCSPEKAKNLMEVILDIKPDLCVEIGVFGGSSLIPQALPLRHNKKGKIYGIDPWTKDAALEEMIEEDHKNWWAALDIEDIYKHCQHNVASLDLDNYCTLVRDKSENVVDMFEDNSIDLLHIDGNHSEALSYKDATLFFPKLKVGGYIFFDDIWWTEKNKVTTRKAIVYLLERCKKVGLVTDCMVMIKN
jgi:predicted O-methyltransferase YrrM